MNTDSATIFVVDDDEAVRDSLEAVLGAAGYRVRSFASAEDFLEHVPADGPGCLLLDVRMPGIGGIELHKELASRRFRLPIVFISGHADVAMAVGAIRNGAYDFIEKPFNPGTLVKKIDQALICWSEGADHARRCGEVHARLARLTAREHQVLDRVVAGDPNKTVAALLGISQKTIETHRFRIMKKMEAKNLPELVQMVLLVRNRVVADRVMEPRAG